MEQPHSEKTVSLHEKEPGVPEPAPEESEIEIYIDPAREVKLLAKLDLAFTPVIMLVYLSCFLDRSNIGMSQTSSMSRSRANCLQETSKSRVC